jgi:hypothetical protein
LKHCFCGLWRCRYSAAKLRDRTQHLPAITEDDAEVFQVLIGHVAKNREINTVFGKALGILGHAERFEPVRNLLHRGSFPADLSWREQASEPRTTEFMRQIPSVVHG